MSDQTLTLTGLETAEEVSGFSCQNGDGASDLEDFLKNDALDYEFAKNISRTYLARQDGNLVGFLTLSCGSFRFKDEGEEAVEIKRRDGLEEITFGIPVVILARLAVDDRYRGNGFGPELFRWGTRLARDGVASQVGCRYLFVDAYANRQSFYEPLGCEMLRGPRGKSLPQRIHMIYDLTA